MTGPEQHAATVRVAISAKFDCSEHIPTVKALDELVALAGRADELKRDAEAMRAAATIRGSFRDEWRRRAVAAEARADELQRERGGYKRDFLAASERVEQARREADQLRAALRDLYEAVRSYLRYPTLAGRFDALNEALTRTDAALVGVQADNEAIARTVRERDAADTGERITFGDLVADVMAANEADNKDSA